MASLGEILKLRPPKIAYELEDSLVH